MIYNNVFEILSSILGIITTILGIIISLNDLNKRSIKNIKIKFDFFKSIILEYKNNKVIAVTGIKEFIGFSISDEMINYIINSTKFYEILNVFKNIYQYVNFDKEEEKFTYKNNKKPDRIKYTIFYILSSIPIIVFISFFDRIVAAKNHSLLLSSLIVLIPITIINISSWLEINNRTLAINLIKKLNDNS
ncbi:MAG: hypothetical protein LBV68_01540 [Spirochaetaceae bacterium]|jgi:hypothetical protein|nr:hypothetical protein [Spirochaetaceae bacterium]